MKSLRSELRLMAFRKETIVFLMSTLVESIPQQDEAAFSELSLLKLRTAIAINLNNEISKE